MASPRVATPASSAATAAPSADELLALLGPGYSISPNDVKGSWDKFTWLARADADLADDVLVYGSVSTGFKSGNIEDGGLLADPETLTNYEVGSKIRFLDGRATLNLAAYDEDFKGYQVNQVVTDGIQAGRPGRQVAGHRDQRQRTPRPAGIEAES